MKAGNLRGILIVVRVKLQNSHQPDITMSTLVDLVDMIEKPEGVHKINTKLFSISFPQLRCLQELALESTNFDYSSAEYRVIAIILDIANFRLFRPVRSDV